jgi:hypothetical protein
MSAVEGSPESPKIVGFEVARDGSVAVAADDLAGCQPTDPRERKGAERVERPAPPGPAPSDAPDQGIVIDFTTVEVRPPASVTVSVTLKVPGAVGHVFFVAGTSFVSLRPFPQLQA